jgi:hypothetical protein
MVVSAENASAKNAGRESFPQMDLTIKARCAIMILAVAVLIWL